MAKRFFYVCAGLFLLLSSYQFGARSAQGQGGNRVVVGGLAGFDTGSGGQNEPIGVDQSGLIRFMGLPPLNPPRPGTITAIEGTPGGGGRMLVLYDDGDVYLHDAAAWTYRGNLLESGPTAGQSQSWGAVKDRYRK